jgi:ABC-type lipoprotein release transport system permease subunit
MSGVAIGAVAALVLTRVFASFSHLLYGVRAGDPGILAAVSLVLVGAAVAACYLPARRAAALEPGTSLRQD